MAEPATVDVNVIVAVIVAGPVIVGVHVNATVEVIATAIR